MELHGRLWCAVVAVFGMAAVASAQPNLVVNGGFETGNFASWFVPPTVPNESLFFVSGGGGHSGTYWGGLSSTSLQFVTQVLPTVAGTDYELSFWLRRSSFVPSGFQVRWEGAYVFQQGINNPDFLTWRQFTVPLHANFNGSVLEFGQSFFPAEFHIDDISVVQVPAPGAAAVLGLAGVVVMRRRRRGGGA